MLIGYAPEVIQAAYRIGDSVTNVIAPMMSYFGLILAMAAKVQERLGNGHAHCHDVALLYGVYRRLDNFVLHLGVLTRYAGGPGAATYYQP